MVVLLSTVPLFLLLHHVRSHGMSTYRLPEQSKFTHSLIHSLTHSLTDLPTPTLTHPLTHSRHPSLGRVMDVKIDRKHYSASICVVSSINFSQTIKNS